MNLVSSQLNNNFSFGIKHHCHTAQLRVKLFEAVQIIIIILLIIIIIIATESSTAVVMENMRMVISRDFMKTHKVKHHSQQIQ